MCLYCFILTASLKATNLKSKVLRNRCLTISPDMCACVESGDRLISLVGPLLFLGLTTTRYPVRPVRPVTWFSWPGMVQWMVNEVGPTRENWRLVGGEMAGGEGIKQVRHSIFNVYVGQYILAVPGPIPVACVPTSGVLAVSLCIAMILMVYSVPGCRPWITADSASPFGAGSSSLSPSSGLEYKTR